MGRLVKAEFRKILTTKLWWALLIPAVGLALGWAWLSAIAFTDVANDITDALDVNNVSDQQLSLSSLALTRAMNFATLFPLVFGALALASEINRKTSRCPAFVSLNSTPTTPMILSLIIRNLMKLKRKKPT